MISRTPGRPRSSTRPRAEEFAQIAATPLLTQPRSEPLWQPRRPTQGPVADLAVTWPDGGTLDLVVPIPTTPQRLGGVRRWFACPRCGERCGRLYSPSAGHRFLCRLCWNLVYASQYEPSESRLLRCLRPAFEALVRVEGDLPDTDPAAWADLGRALCRLTRSAEREARRRRSRVSSEARHPPFTGTQAHHTQVNEPCDQGRGVPR